MGDNLKHTMNELARLNMMKRYLEKEWENDSNKVVVISKHGMTLLTKSSSNILHLKLKYILCLSSNNIVMELVRTGMKNRPNTVLPYGFKKLSEEERKTYVLSEINFKTLSNDNIAYIKKTVPMKRSLNFYGWYKLLTLIDMLGFMGNGNPKSSENKTRWVMVNWNALQNYLILDTQEMKLLVDDLIKCEILIKAETENNIAYAVALNKEDIIALKESVCNNAVWSSDIVMIGYHYAAKVKKKNILIQYSSNIGDSIQEYIEEKQKEAMPLDTNVTDEPTNDNIASLTTALFSAVSKRAISCSGLKTRNEELALKIRELEEQQERDRSVFLKLDEVNKENAKILETSYKDDDVKQYTKDILDKITKLVDGHMLKTNECIMKHDDITTLKVNLLALSADLKSSILNAFAVTKIKKSLNEDDGEEE